MDLIRKLRDLAGLARDAMGLGDELALKPGDRAPDFSAPDQNGARRTLADYRGKRLLLWFYPRAETPGCTLEGSGFRERIHEFASRHTEVVGVSFDPVAANCSFAAKRGFDYPLLSDLDRRMALAYGAAADSAAGFARRVSFLIDEQGVVLKTYSRVNPAAHPDEVLRDLDAFGKAAGPGAVPGASPGPPERG